MGEELFYLRKDNSPEDTTEEFDSLHPYNSTPLAVMAPQGGVGHRMQMGPVLMQWVHWCNSHVMSTRQCFTAFPHTHPLLAFLSTSSTMSLELCRGWYRCPTRVSTHQHSALWPCLSFSINCHALQPEDCLTKAEVTGCPWILAFLLCDWEVCCLKWSYFLSSKREPKYLKKAVSIVRQ